MAKTELRGVLPYLISPVTDTGEINAIDFPAGREIKSAVIGAVKEDQTSYGAQGATQMEWSWFVRR